MTKTHLHHFVCGLLILSLVQVAPFQEAGSNRRHHRNHLKNDGQEFRRHFSTPQITSAESWTAQEMNDELRGEVIGPDSPLVTGVEEPSDLTIPGDDPILWSPTYHSSKKKHKGASRKTIKETQQVKHGRKKCLPQMLRRSRKRKRTGGSDCEEEEGTLPTNAHLAQQDMSNDPALQDMPNTVGPNPNIFGGFPENDIWGNFELPSPETIDHLKLALKMNHHRPSYSEDQASDANDQLYSYEHHALPEYDILETPPFQHLLWQNAQLQQVMKAGGNGCPPGMGSCPPTNNQVTCENLNDICAANAQHKPVNQPEYEAPCPQKILQLFGCGAPTKPPPLEKPEEEEAIPVKPPKPKKKPDKDDDEEKKKKPPPIPLQITSEGGANTGDAQKILANDLGTLTAKAKLKAATALKELTEDIRNMVEQHGKKVPESADAGLAQIISQAHGQPHEKHLITSTTHAKQEFFSAGKIGEANDATHKHMEPDSLLDRAHELPVTASLVMTNPDNAKLHSPTGRDATEFSPEASVAMMTLLGHDLEEGLEEKLKGNSPFVAGLGLKARSSNKLHGVTETHEDKSIDRPSATNAASLTQHDNTLKENDREELTTTFDTLNGVKPSDEGAAYKGSTFQHLAGLHDAVKSQASSPAAVQQSRPGEADIASSEQLKSFARQGDKRLQEIADILNAKAERPNSNTLFASRLKEHLPVKLGTKTSGMPHVVPQGNSTESHLPQQRKAIGNQEDTAAMLARLNGETENDIQEAPSKPTWGPWTKCSSTCGIGQMSRLLQCIDAEQCASTNELFQTKPCRLAPCEDVTGGIRFKTDCLPLHNEFRRRHGAAPVAWSDALYKKAAEIAERVASLPVPAEALSKYEQPGLNLAVVSLENVSNNRTETAPCMRAVETWYSAKSNYNFESPKLTAENRDFTQLVWKGTKQIGIAKSLSTDGKLAYIAAVYQPAGNVDSYYDMKKNALPLQEKEEEKTLEFLDKLLTTKKQKKSIVLRDTNKDKIQDLWLEKDANGEARAKAKENT